MTTEPTHEAAFFATIRSWGLVRSRQRVLGGVIAGVGERIGMAAAPARLLFVLVTLFTGGVALLAYAAAWALLPDSDGRIVIQDFGRGRPNVGTLVVVVIMGIIGFVLLDHSGPLLGWGWWDAFSGARGRMFAPLAVLLVPLVVIGGIVALIVWAVRSSRPSDRSAQGFARLPDGTIPQAPASPAAVAGQEKVPDAVAEASAEPATASGPVTPPPPVYTAPPVPPRPRVPGPGRVGYLLALAWIPLTIAITLYLHATDRLAVFPPVAAGTIYVAGLGLILVITALQGRRPGFLGFVSVLALIPMALNIGFASELRDQYASGQTWRGWVRSHIEQDRAPHPWPSAVAPAAPPFDPNVTFGDYDAVVIDGTCQSITDAPDRAGYGVIRLASLAQDQTVTVTDQGTRLIVPRSTNLVIASDTGDELGTDMAVTWVDRRVSCDVNASGVSLTNPNAPTLTVLVDSYANAPLFIEEN